MKKRELFKAGAEETKLLQQAGSNDPRQAYAAQLEIAKALELPLRQGILSGDVVGALNIFEPIQIPPGPNSTAEFPLHFMAPGTEDEYVAFTIPNSGYISQRSVEGDKVNVPIYDVGNALDTNLKYIRDSRWDVVSAMGEALRAGFIKKDNDDAFNTLLTAGYDRNIVVTDSDAAAGQFTKRLVSLMQLVMRRNGGGNSTSMNRGKLTDLVLSPEGMEDIRAWSVADVDEVTRREIFVAEGDQALSRIFGVNLMVMDEFGEGQEYQLFYDNELSGTLPGTDVELVLGLDLANRRSFVHPIKSEVELFPDEFLHRQRRFGMFGWKENGWAVLDQRNVLLGSL